MKCFSAVYRFVLWGMIASWVGCASQQALHQITDSAQNLQYTSQLIQQEIAEVEAAATELQQQFSHTETIVEDTRHQWIILQEQAERLRRELHEGQSRVRALRKRYEAEQAPLHYPLHIIRKGDTLWDLSEHYLVDPLRWPEIWELNRYVSSPNLLYPGNSLVLPGMRVQEVTTAEKKEPPPSSLIEKTDIIGETAETPSPFLPEKSSQEPLSVSPLLVGGYIAPQLIPSLGVIIASQEGKTALSSFDTVYLQVMPGVELSPGSTYLIFRQEQVVSHPITGEKLGYLLSVLGDLRIQEVEEARATALIHSARDVIYPGDQIQEIPFMLAPLVSLPIPLQLLNQKLEGYIVESKRGKVVLSLYDVVYIDRGYRHGVTPGDLFSVVRSQSLEGVPSYLGPTLPSGPLPVEIGKIQIIIAQETTSTALVVSSQEGFSVGAKVVYSRSHAQ